MWNKLRARHYSILVLLSIVSLETSAIAIDRYLSKGDDAAFEVEGRFRNNAFVTRFQQADAQHGAIPATLSQVAQAAQAADIRLAASKSVASQRNVTFGVKPAGNELAPASKALPDCDTWISYAVKKGDSLKAIADMFGTKAATLAQANGLNTSSIKAGQTIRIPAPDNRIVYTVRAGDSLNKIASRFGTSIPGLIRENNLKSHVLIEDQKIYIPIQKKTQDLTIAKSGDVQTVIAPPLIKIEKEAAKIAKIDGPTLQIAAATPDKPSVTITQHDATSKPAPVAAQPTVAAAPKAVAPAPAPTPVAASLVKPVVAMAPAVKPQPAPAQAPVQITQAPQPAPQAAAPAVDADTRIVQHTVKNGENLATIARQYKTSIGNILAHNKLSNSALKTGQQVCVPVDKKYYRVMQVTSRKADVSTRMVMPVRGSLSDSYGWRKHPVYRKRLFHAGIDISAPRGTQISAAMPGTVVYAGWLSGYGKLVVIRHANGLSTRYGHCSKISVRKGQTVKAGQAIANVGATGVATGNHLHFEVRRNGRTVNPSPLLFGR
ncbi:MAG TPA: LysM peptidoglycan-binding domain-containing protein [Candidatus Ozemobacteraceae bacterium]|nr:LysM peptidoglycan-binding domain-containing protein [Candidatus Ozemobacteraceae bacterium]